MQRAIEQFTAGLDPKYAAGGEVLTDVVGSLVKARLLPARLSSPLERAPVNPLEWIVAGQAERNIQLGLASEVYPGLSPEDAAEQYRNDFIVPKGAYSLAESYRGRFDVALAVDPRIELVRKHELAGRIKELGLDSIVGKWRTSRVQEFIDTGRIQDLTDHPTKVPYLVFTHDGQRFRYISVEEAISRFESDEVGNPQLEVTDLFLKHPEYFNHRGMFAVGSRSEDGDVPCLATWRGHPKVGAPLVGYPRRGLGALSRGEDFIELGA